MIPPRSSLAPFTAGDFSIRSGPPSDLGRTWDFSPCSGASPDPSLSLIPTAIPRFSLSRRNDETLNSSFSHSSTLFCYGHFPNSFAIKSFRTLSAKHPGVAPRCNARRQAHSSIVCLQGHRGTPSGTRTKRCNSIPLYHLLHSSTHSAGRPQTSAPFRCREAFLSTFDGRRATLQVQSPHVQGNP